MSHPSAAAHISRKGRSDGQNWTKGTTVNAAIIITAIWIILAAAGWAFVHGAAKLRRLEEAQLQSVQSPDAEIIELPLAAAAEEVAVAA